MSVDHKSTIDANKTDLLEVLRVSELLLTELCGEDVLDQRTKQEILAGGIQYEINGRFLDWLKQSQPSTFTVCLEKLRGDQQKHIANLLDGTPGERPLTREKRKQIQKNIRHLSEVIDVDSGLLMVMCSKRALSPRDQQEVNSEKATEDKAMKLLQIILQKSDLTLKCFVDALRETNQAHIISALEKGNIIALHAEFQSATYLLDQFEEDLINILEPLAQQVSYLDNEEDQAEEVQPIIHELQQICQKRIQILSLKKGKSIIIYLWCEDIKAMAELFLMFETRHLEHILEKIFNLVKTSVKISNVMIRVTLVAADLQILKEAAQLNELAQNKPELAERDSFSESREGDELQPPSFIIKEEPKEELNMSKVELQMTKQVSVPKETVPEMRRPELQLNVEIAASENIRLKEKLEAVEQEKSKLKQQLQLMQNENTVLRKELEKAKAEIDKMQDRQWRRVGDSRGCGRIGWPLEEAALWLPGIFFRLISY